MLENANQVIFQVTKLNVLWFVLGLILIMSIIAPITVILDKKFAIKNKQRVPEKTLFTLALFGGALTEYIAMNTVRHKTLHKRFMIGLPVIFTLQIALFIWWLVAWF